jgi:integrase
MKFAIDAGWRSDDPTLRIKTFPEHEFHTWTEDEIAQYEDRWPIGSRERTSYALHLYTGQRRADVARMAWTDVAGNAINVVQAKTGARLTIPLHPNLSAALRAWPRNNVVMLTTAFNKPFTYAGYGNMMADAIAAAGLPDRCVLHGLRKAAARRLAEAGCTEKEIAAVTGHTTLKEVARYTRAADQKRLAAGAVAKLVEQKPHENSQPSKSGLGKTEKR